jgi:hypothetical protein
MALCHTMISLNILFLTFGLAATKKCAFWVMDNYSWILRTNISNMGKSESRFRSFVEAILDISDLLPTSFNNCINPRRNCSSPQDL